MRRGIIMGEGRRGLVVLTPEGEFVEVPGRSGSVGEEIGFAPHVRRTSPGRRLLLSASAAAILLLAAVGLARLPVFGGPEVAAYVAIDINPSVEIGVDRKRAVVELNALNPEGERVIEGVAYRKRPVGDVAADIIRNAAAAEYLREGGEVFITSMAADGVDGQYEAELVREIDRAVHAAAPGSGEEPGQGGTEADADPDGSAAVNPGSGRETGGANGNSGADPGAGGSPAQPGPQDGIATAPGGKSAVPKSGPAGSSGQGIAVTVVRAPGELRETAKANGVSPGKMAVYLLAEKRGLPISLDELKRGSIRQAVEPYGGLSGLLGDGRSDEERKRELAELLEKETAAKARGKSADASGGGKASADGGSKAPAQSGKKSPENRGGKAPSAADKASAGIGKPPGREWQAEGRNGQRQGTGRQSLTELVREKQREQPERRDRQEEKRKERDDRQRLSRQNPGPRPEGTLKGPNPRQNNAGRQEEKKQNPQQSRMQKPRETQKPQTQRDDGRLRQDEKRKSQSQKQETQTHKQELKPQKGKDQQQQQQQKRDQQDPRPGKNAAGRGDGGRNAESYAGVRRDGQRDERLTGSFVRPDGLQRIAAAYGGASDESAGTKFLPI